MTTEIIDMKKLILTNRIVLIATKESLVLEDYEDDDYKIDKESAIKIKKVIDFFLEGSNNE